MAEIPENPPQIVRKDSFCGYVRSDVDPSIILRLVKAFHAGKLPPGSLKLSDHAGKYESCFVPLPAPPGEVLFKHFSHRRISRFVWPYLGVSKGMHSWRMAQRLRQKPALCSSPVAALERRWGPFVLDSYFMMEWIQPGKSYMEAATDHLIGGARTKEKVFGDLAEFMAELHRRDVFHSGLHAENILEEAIQPPRLLMIDLDAASIRPSMSNRDRMQMLFDAFEYFLLVCDPEDFGELVKYYSRAARIPTDSLQPYMAQAMKRLEQKSARIRIQAALYREERAIKLLTWPSSRAWRIGAEYVQSWDNVLGKLKSRGMLCAARRGIDSIREAVPHVWLRKLEEEARSEEAQTGETLAKLQQYLQALIASGVRPLLLGRLPLLKHYPYCLGTAALTPFEIVVPPDEVQRAADLIEKGPALEVKIGAAVDLASEEARLRLSPALLMQNAREFDFGGLRLLTLAPDLAFLYYAARCAASGRGDYLNASMDFTVFLNSCAKEISLDKVAGMVRDHSAEALIWGAIRWVRLFNVGRCAPAEEAARRIAIAPE